MGFESEDWTGQSRKAMLSSLKQRIMVADLSLRALLEFDLIQVIIIKNAR